MEASPWFRVQVLAEDADDDGLVYVGSGIPEDDDEDALDHALPFEALWPDWHCDDCGTRNEGARISCKYCGTVREDVDL